ncbi:MAG TPA: MATE family efflux transporter [Rubricoccaceae bacterium]
MSRSAARREIRATLVLALPFVLTQLVQMSMSFLDVVMVGRVGTDALAAAVLGSTLYFTLMLVAMGVITAVQPSVAQAVGAGDDVGAGRAARQGLWLAVLLGVPGFVLVGFAEPILRAAGQMPETAALAARYLAAERWGLVPTLLFTALRGLCEGAARPRPVLVATAVGLVLNVSLNAILIYGLLGAPALGLVGAGWASSIATTVMVVGLGAYVWRGPLGRFRLFDGIARPDWTALWGLFRLGWPIGINFGLESGLFTVATLLIGRMGETSLAAHQIALNAASVAFMVPLGIGMAGGVRVGQAAGAGDLPAAARAGWASIGLGAASMAASALVFWFVPSLIVWIYAGADAEPGLVRQTAALLAIAAVFQLFDGTQAAAAGALRGLKDTRAPMAISAVSYWGLGLGLGAYLLFELDQGAPGMWWGLTLGLAAAAVLLTTRFRRLVRQQASPHAAQTVRVR